MLAALALALRAQQAETARPAAPAPPADVVVRGSTDAELRRLTEALTRSTQGRQLSRWHRSVCASVIGFDDRHGAFIKARLTSLADSLGLKPPAERCAPNVFVIGTTGADGFTRALVKRSPGLFGNPNYGVAHGAGINPLLVPRPVRWIQGSQTVVSDCAVEGYCNSYALNSRIKMPTHESLTASIVIVDLDKLNGLVWQQLADYVALVALARPKLDADYGPGTILSLFAARDRGERGPAGLTAEDQAFLTALYRSNGEQAGWAQRYDIVRRMAAGAKR